MKVMHGTIGNNGITLIQHAALNYYNTQNRGTYNITYNDGHPFVTYFNDADNPHTIGERHYTITPDKADLPYPEADLLIAPNLALPPVPFDFSKIRVLNLKQEHSNCPKTKHLYE